MTTSKQFSPTHAFRMWTTAFLAACVIVAVHRGRVYAGGYEWAGLGSRAQSMGGAFIGKSNDWTAIYWNPAGLTQLQGSESTVSVFRCRACFRVFRKRAADSATPI